MDTTPETTSPTKSSGGWGRIIAVLVILILIAVAAVFYLKPGIFGNVAATKDNVVATVNGTPILEEHINERIARNQSALLSQGIDTTNPDTRAGLEDQVLEQLINEELVLMAAADAGLMATDAEVTAQLDAIKAQFETEEAFAAQLTENNFTEETLRENLERDITIQKYIQQIASVDPITVTEEEITSAYETILASTEEEVPPLEDVRAQLEAQLQNQKLAVAVAAAVEALKADAEIIIEEEGTEEAGA